MPELAQFTNSLLDSVQHFLYRKKDLSRVSKIEAEDFFKRLTKNHKGILDHVIVLLKEVNELKPSIEAKITKALEFTSMFDREEHNSKNQTAAFSAIPGNTIQNLVNLRKTLNSPRDGRDRSRGDETNRSGRSREPQADSMEQQFKLEHLRHQVAVLQSEIDRRDSRVL